jgi:tetratricopeptide (TPR) repeat protein
MAEELSPGSLSDRLAIEGEVVAFGQRLLREGHAEEALKFFRRMVKLFPESPAIYACLGEAYLARGDREHAQESFERSGELERARHHGGGAEPRGA